MSDYEPSIGTEERIRFAETKLIIPRKTWWGTRDNSPQSQARLAGRMIYTVNVHRTTFLKERRFFDVWARIKNDSGLYVYTIDVASPEQVARLEEEQRVIAVALSRSYDGGFARLNLISDRLDELADFKLK